MIPKISPLHDKILLNTIGNFNSNCESPPVRRRCNSGESHSSITIIFARNTLQTATTTSITAKDCRWSASMESVGRLGWLMVAPLLPSGHSQPCPHRASPIQQSTRAAVKKQTAQARAVRASSCIVGADPEPAPLPPVSDFSSTSCFEILLLRYL